MAQFSTTLFFIFSLICVWVAPALSQTTLNRQGWTVTADSSSTGNAASNAIDGSLTTFWESSTGALPHRLIVDMKSAYIVNGVSILPRQDVASGRIGQHTVELSADGTNWGAPVVIGTYFNDIRLKRSTFVNRPARYVRLSALSAPTGGTVTSVCDFNVYGLPDPAVSRAGWAVSADSQETAGESGFAANAIDGNPNTIWHTQYINGLPGLPHSFTINQGSAKAVNGLRYLPRPGGSGGNGRIGQYTLQASNDGTTWTQIASGTWPDTADEKVAYFTARTTQYVRLNALTEAGGRGPWTSAAEINLVNGNNVAQYTAPNPTKGLWKHTIDFPLVPAAAAIIPQTGKVLMWSAFKYDDFGGGGGSTVSAIYDPATGGVSQRVVSNTGHDMFCPGISMDVNGRVIVTGGNNAEKTTIYNFATDSWIGGPNMKLARGYQSSVTTSQGKIFTIGGSWSGGQGNKNGEIYDPTANTWTLLSGCPVAPILTGDREGVYRADNHAWLFGWRDGSVFQAGPSRAMNWYGTLNTGSRTAAGNRGTDTDSMNGNAVMYDAAAGKIFTVGGALHYGNENAHNRAYVVTIGAPNTTPTVSSVGSMASPRAYHNSIALPDGKVLVLGGQGYPVPFTDSTPVNAPELWDPATGAFTQLNSHATARTYHSVALLLPDGTVLLGGGGLCGGCAVNHFDGELFEPPYLFNSDGTRASRPSINSVSTTTVSAGGTLTVVTSTNISRFALVRLSSATHSVNTDQRRIVLTPSGSPSGYTITVPGDKGISNPGYYMLFALNSAGVPSTARIIKVQ